MPQLDLFTVRAMTLITVLVAGLATAFSWKINRSVAGMRLFALGLLSMGAGSVIGLAAALVPDDAVLVGDAIMIVGIVFRIGGLVAVVQGIRAFRGFPPLSRTILTLFAAIVSIVFFYALFGRDSVGIRLGVISVALALLAGNASLSMLRGVSQKRTA